MAYYPQGAMSPQGLAVDNSGHIFVADPNGWGGAVAEFAAGATGQQQPKSFLNLFADAPDRLGIDGVGRLFVHYNSGQKIAIFAQGARGHDAPLSIVPSFYKGDLVVDYPIAKDGELYALNYSGPVAIYDDPLNNPLKPTRLMWPDGGYEFTFDQSLALDAATNRLYIEFAVQDSRYRNKVNFGVRPRSGTSTATDSPIFTGDCGPIGESSVGGAIVVKKYLVVSCNDNSGVLVYRSDQFGRQGAPVESVGVGTLCCPWQIAIGP